MNLTDPTLLSPCLDTGHFRIGGGDPLRFLRKNFSRIWHVHFKECHPFLADRFRHGGWDYFTSVRNGIICELVKREIDFQMVKAEPEKQGNNRWIVVEQNVLPRIGSLKESAR